MNTWNWITVLASGLFVLLPTVIATMPAAWRELATAIFGVGVALFHLYMPSPSTK